MTRTKKTTIPQPEPQNYLPIWLQEVIGHPITIGTGIPLGITYVLTALLYPLIGDVVDAIIVIVMIITLVGAAYMAWNCYKEGFPEVRLFGVMAVFTLIYVAIPFPGTSSYIIYGLLAAFDAGGILSICWHLYQQQEIKPIIALVIICLILSIGAYSSFTAIGGASYTGTWVSDSGNYQVELKSNKSATVTVRLKSYSESYNTEWRTENFPELGGKCAVYWGDSRHESVAIIAPNGVLYSDRGGGLSQSGYFLHKK